MDQQSPGSLLQAQKTPSAANIYQKNYFNSQHYLLSYPFTKNKN